MNKAIDWEKCVQLMAGKEHHAKAMLIEFVEQLQLNRHEMSSSLKNLDYLNLREQVHKLHGACCYCGVPALKIDCYTLESALEAQMNPDEIAKLYSQLEGSMDNVVEAFETGSY